MISKLRPVERMTMALGPGRGQGWQRGSEHHAQRVAIETPQKNGTTTEEKLRTKNHSCPMVQRRVRETEKGSPRTRMD